MQAQNYKPEKGLFFYSDGYHTTEIEFFPKNTMCVINTTYDVAIFEASCGTYCWHGDSLVFNIDPKMFLQKHLVIDTHGCKPGEVLINLKTIAPYNEPEWRDIDAAHSSIVVKAEDYFKTLNVVPCNQQVLPFSEIVGFDSLYFLNRGIINPGILIPEASCMNIEYPLLRKRTLDNSRDYKKFIFAQILKNESQVTILENNHTYKMNFKYIKRDPFNNQ